MKMSRVVVVSVVAATMLCSGAAVGQGKPGCDAQSKGNSPEKVEGQVVTIDNAGGKLTLREADGKTYEFYASKEILQNLKVGDRLEAKLRPAANC